MKQKILVCVVAAVLSMGFSPSQAQTTVSSAPVGFVTVNIPGSSSSTSRRESLVSFPLLEVPSNLAGQVTGTITGVTSNSLSNTNAGWQVGQLSDPASPYAIQITTGAGAGRIFLISSSSTVGGASGSAALANTASTVFLSSIEINGGNIPTAPGISVAAGDSYRIITVDTLLSLFGTPTTSSVRGGTNVTSADTVTANPYAVTATYFFNTATNLNRWVKQGPSTISQNNVPLHPYFGVRYARLGTNPFSIVAPGTVPNTASRIQIRNSGTFTLARYWPSDGTLNDLGLHNLPNWVKATPTNSDTVTIIATNGVSSTYYHNGTNWRLVGPGTVSRDSVPVPAGSAVTVTRRSATNPGSVTLNNPVPYSL